MPSSTPSLFSATASDSPRPASSGWVTANTDGGARGNPGPAGYGVVVVDESGQRVAELSEYLGVRTNNVAEYSALLGALAWAEANGQRKLRVISDSELMVKQIQGKYKVASPDLRPLFEEARRRIARLDRFEIQHALRAKNKVADELANRAMDRGMGRSPEARIESSPASSPASRPTAPRAPQPAAAQAARPGMLRGFVRDGVVHLLGGTTLPNGLFVKIIPEE
jgi:probable phosphoglycerate mutase